MQYRIYDSMEKTWVKDNIYLAPDGNLYEKRKSFFGITKLNIIGNIHRYIIHKAIKLYDKNYDYIYEGDLLEAQVEEDKKIRGVVIYSEELSSYIILCHDTDEYYTLGQHVEELIEIVGNVFDGYNDEKYEGQQTL